MWLETVSGTEDHKEKCPTCGGHVQRRAYGEMYAGSYVLDGQRVEIRRVPNSTYIDPIVLDPITQYFDGGLYRIYPADRYFSRGGKKLHRHVWESAFGPIPRDCHIHHKDSNPTNNLLGNLECLPAKQHLSDTARKHKHSLSPFAREKAAEWHQSEEGRLWHSRHALRAKGWLKWKHEDKPCEACGKVVRMLVRKSGPTQKYCSNACGAVAYRRREAAKRTR